MFSSKIMKHLQRSTRHTASQPFEFFSLFPSYKCNFNCSYCCCHTVTGERSHLPSGTELCASDYLKLNQIKHLLPQQTLHIHGGEPLLYSDINSLLHGLEFPDIVVVSNLSVPIDSRVSFLEALKGKVHFVGSYHPEYANFSTFMDNARKLSQLGMLLRVSGVGDSITSEIFEKFKIEGIDLVIYPYKGLKDGVIYPEDMRSHARGWITGEAGTCKSCRSLKFLVDPVGNVWNCSTHMYLNNMDYCYGNILTGFTLEPKFYPCTYYHYCNPCQGDFVDYQEPPSWLRFKSGRAYQQRTLY